MEAIPQSIGVQTTTLKSGIGYAISVLGAIPLRYNQPRFPCLRRLSSDDTREKKLLALGGGTDFPPIFGLASFSSIGQPSAPKGNRAVLRGGVNLGKTNGNNIRLSGSFVEVILTANIYSDSLDTLLAWVSSATKTPIFKGMSEFNSGGSVPITVNITPTFDWTDPVLQDAGVDFLTRRFSVSVNFTMNTFSAEIRTTPLFKAFIEKISVEGTTDIEEIDIPVDVTDWP